MVKVAMAISGMITGLGLAVFGFIANKPQSVTALTGIKVLPLQPKNHVPYGSMVYTDPMHPNIGLDDQCLEYSGLGRGDFREPAIELSYSDGSMTTSFLYKSHKSHKGRIRIPGLPSALGDENNCETTEVELCDNEKGMTLTLFYCVYEGFDVITRFASLKNNSGNKVNIRRRESFSVSLKKLQILA